MELGLRDKVVLITGASKGVGRETALFLAREGADVAISYLSSTDEAAGTVRDIEAIGVRSVAVGMDVGDYDQVASGVAQVVDALGRIDVLVNNAGYFRVERFVESRPASWAPIIAGSLLGVMHASHAVLPGMIERRSGRIITIVGESGRVGDSGMAVTSGARGGAVTFTKALAKEVGRFNITTNVVALGLIKTHSFPPHLGKPENAERALQSYVIRRFGEATEPAGAIAFLASASAGWITGQVLGVSGGYAIV